MSAPPSANGPSNTSRSLHRLELDWPVLQPLSVSYTTTPTPTYEPLHLPTLDWQAVWWKLGALSLRTLTSVAPALELDCSLTCQPLLKQSLGFEAQFGLGGRGVVPETHLFLRNERMSTPAAGGARNVPLRTASKLSFGLAGLLDF